MHILNKFGNKAEGLGGQLTFKLIVPHNDTCIENMNGDKYLNEETNIDSIQKCVKRNNRTR